MDTIVNTPSGNNDNGFGPGLIIGIIVVVILIILFFVMGNKAPADEPADINTTVPANNEGEQPSSIFNTTVNSTTTITGTTTQ